jgi:hypothetical protein
MIRSLSLCFAILSTSQWVLADLDSAGRALAGGDYDTAAREFRILADQGDAGAQANLGYMYYVGEGVPQSYEEAVNWYRKAAVQGHRDAQYNLAVAYAFGEGVTRNFEEAAVWYGRAAEQGHMLARYSLGLSYASGEGVRQNPQEAARWFSMAAEQGYDRAQVQLGSKYYTGDGVPQDYDQAVKWYRMAAEGGNAAAQYNLGAMYRSGEGVAQDNDEALRWFRLAAGQNHTGAQNELNAFERAMAEAAPAQTIPDSRQEQQAEQRKPLFTVDSDQLLRIEEATSNAATLPVDSMLDPAPQIAATGSTVGASGSMVADEVETKEEAVADKPGFFSRLLSKIQKQPAQAGEDAVVTAHVAAETGIAASAESAAAAVAIPDQEPAREDATETATPARPGSGLIRNIFNRGASGETADQGANVAETAFDADPEAIEEAFKALANREYETAYNEFRSLAVQGDHASQYQLALLYSQGLGVSQNYTEATHWYQRAAEQGDVNAQYSMGNMYLMGEGIEQDDSKAAYWYEMAAAQGHKSAQHNLAQITRFAKQTRAKPAVDASLEKQATDTPATAKAAAAEEEKSRFGFIRNIFRKDTAEASPVTASGQTREVQPPPAPVSAAAPGQDVDTAMSILQGETSTAQEAYVIAVAHYEKGLSYSGGEGMEKDSAEAFRWFKQSAELGYAPAQNKVGAAYAYGDGVEQNAIEAASWYHLAARQGYAMAQRNLGVMYSLGEGLKQDKPMALAWYSILAENGNVMDIRRRDLLENELTAAERERARQIKEELLRDINSADN